MNTKVTSYRRILKTSSITSSISNYELGFGESAFPIAERIHQNVLSLPMGPHLETRSVSAVIKAFEIINK